MNICVFCSSQDGLHPSYVKDAWELGLLIGNHGHSLIYGGSRKGLMGIVAEATQKAGGKVVGIIPEVFREFAKGEDEVVIVPDIRVRIEKMDQRSDAYISLGGGFGTLHESLDVLVYRQIQIHSKPFALVNTNNVYKKFSECLDHLCDQGFTRACDKDIYRIVDTPQQALDYIYSYKPTVTLVPKVG